ADGRLQALILDPTTPRKTRLGALWTRISRGPLAREFHLALLADPDPGLRAWGVRAAGNMRRVEPAVREKVSKLAHDPSPNVRLQVAIAAGKIEGIETVALLMEVASACGNDPLIPHIVWQNLYPLLENEGDRFIATVDGSAATLGPGLIPVLTRALDLFLRQ